MAAVIPLPLRDDNPTSRFPIATVLLIGANVVFWLFELTYKYQIGGDHVAAATLDFGAIPAWILHQQREGLITLGHHESVRLYQEAPWPTTIFTSMFMHGSWIHIIGNMWFLWIFGDNIEEAMGSVRYVLFYLLCGIIAALSQIFATPSSIAPMVGASGAVAGVLGGYALLYPRARVRCLWLLIIILTTIELPAWLLLGLWFVSQFFVPMGAGVAWMAHVGGFLGGLGLVRLFVRAGPIKPRRVVWNDFR